MVSASAAPESPFRAPGGKRRRVVGDWRGEVNQPELYRDRARLPRNLIQIPVVQQSQGFSCGVAAALAILRYWRIDAYARVEEAALYDVLRTTPAAGTEPEPMAALFHRSGPAVPQRFHRRIESGGKSEPTASCWWFEFRDNCD